MSVGSIGECVEEAKCGEREARGPDPTQFT